MNDDPRTLMGQYCDGDAAAFRGLPATTKDNYYRQYPLPELCRHGQLDACDMVALSTGSTGEPAVWPRFISDELATAARFEQVLRDGFAAGRTIEGQIYLVECLAELGETLETLPQGERDAYCRRHPEVASALELHRRRHPGAGAPS